MTTLILNDGVSDIVTNAWTASAYPAYSKNGIVNIEYLFGRGNFSLKVEIHLDEFIELVKDGGPVLDLRKWRMRS